MFPSSQDLLEKFTAISLEDIGTASLPRRVETKYLLHESQVPGFLELLTRKCFCLQIGHQRSFQYTTNYFDTADSRLYLDHHNGYLRRMKVRCRRYDATGECFLEIKQKVNEQRSDKQRFAVESLTTLPGKHLAAQISYPHIRDQQLLYALTSTFLRSSFCNAAFTERITIDTGIAADDGQRLQSFSNLALVEIKQMNFTHNSAAMIALKTVGAIRTPFSKYALGKALLQPELRHNNFKPTLSLLAKHSFL